MKLTCIIPVYNEPEELLLRSLNSAGQCDRVLIVDDGSAVPVDNLGSRAEIVRKENGGCASALNAGILKADIDSWIVRLDCGDVLKPNKREQILFALDGGYQSAFSPSYDLVNSRPFEVAQNWRARLRTDNQFAASTTVFRRCAWHVVGGLDEGLKWCDDWDFACKVQGRFGWAHYPGVTADVGCFPGGMAEQAKQDSQAFNRDRATVSKRARQIEVRA